MLDVKKLRETAADYSKFGYGSRVCLDPDSVNELLDRLEAAEQERDEAQRITRAALDQRDALSAHVELGSRIVHEWGLGAFGDVAAAQQLNEWFSAGPTTSLARHPDDVAVDRFAGAMKAKLARAREKGRGGWEDIHACRVRDLVDMMIGHLSKGNEGTWEDVANFCMMLHQRGDAPAELADGMARLIAEKQAEVLGDISREIGNMYFKTPLDEVARAVRKHADELRRQAEEEQQ